SQVQPGLGEIGLKAQNAHGDRQHQQNGHIGGEEQDNPFHGFSFKARIVCGPEALSRIDKGYRPPRHNKIRFSYCYCSVLSNRFASCSITSTCTTSAPSPRPAPSTRRPKSCI